MVPEVCMFSRRIVGVVVFDGCWLRLVDGIGHLRVGVATWRCLVGVEGVTVV